MLRKKRYASLHPEPLKHFLAGISLPLLFSRLIWEGNVPVACLDKKKIPLTSVEYLKQNCLCFPKAVEPVGWMDADAWAPLPCSWSWRCWHKGSWTKQTVHHDKSIAAEFRLCALSLGGFWCVRAMPPALSDRCEHGGRAEIVAGSIFWLEEMKISCVWSLRLLSHTFRCRCVKYVSFYWCLSMDRSSASFTCH